MVHADDARLRRLSVLDAVLNNADRKGGHLLLDAPARCTASTTASACTRGEAPHAAVGLGGRELTGEAVEVLSQLAHDLGGDLGEALHDHLTEGRGAAVAARVERLLASGRHPGPARGGRRCPGRRSDRSGRAALFHAGQLLTSRRRTGDWLVLVTVLGLTSVFGRPPPAGRVERPVMTGLGGVLDRVEAPW